MKCFKIIILLFIIGYISNASAIEIVTDPWKVPIFVITSEISDTVKDNHIPQQRAILFPTCKSDLALM